MRKEIFETVANCLKTLEDPATGEKLIKHIGLWQTSITDAGYEVSFPTPAVFIEFMPASWKTLCGSGQSCEMQLRLHLIEYTNEGLDEVALHGFKLIETIVKQLTGCTCKNGSKFLRIESLTNHESEKVKDCMETFKILI